MSRFVVMKTSRFVRLSIGLLLLILFLFILVEWLQREREHALQFDNLRLPKGIRWGLYYVIIWGILYFGGVQQEFIYFQF